MQQQEFSIRRKADANAPGAPAPAPGGPAPASDNPAPTPSAAAPAPSAPQPAPAPAPAAGAQEEPPSQAEAAVPEASWLSPEEKARLIVPDCHGGKILAPYWLRHVDFGAALCIQASAKKALRVDIGTNLVAAGDARRGDVESFQVYYSLSQVEVPAGNRQVVWAVCGGDGYPLPHGTRMFPGTRLRKEQVEKIAASLSRLDEYSNMIMVFKQQLLQNKPVGSQLQFLTAQIERLETLIGQEAGLLREAIRTDVSTTTVKKGFKPRRKPVWGP